MDARTLVLFRGESATNPWSTEVSLRENGDVAFCSGDLSHEWFAIVRARHVPALQAALLPPNSQPKVGNGEVDLLALLETRFARHGDDADNPFEEVKAFLDSQHIKWEHDFW